MEGAQKFKHCEVCNKDFRRSSFSKHFKSKLHTQNEEIIPHNFIKKFRPEPIQQQARTIPTLSIPSKKNQSLKKS